MNIGIGIETDEETFENCILVNDFVKSLSGVIEARDYGPGLEHFTIGLVALRTVPGYESWFKERKPRFQKVHKVRITDQSVLELHNCYSYDIKLSDAEIDEFVASGEAALRIFCERFISSLVYFDKPSIKRLDFDVEKFRSDVKSLIRSRMLKE